MNYFLLSNASKELSQFPQISELAARKNTTIQFNSFRKETSDHIRFYFITDGKFEWVINQQHYILFPGDLAIILPGQVVGGEKDYLDIGTVLWLHLQVENFDSNGNLRLGKWSSLSEAERNTIGKILMLNSTPVLSKLNEFHSVFQCIYQEITNQEIGYVSRVQQLIEEIFILIARKLTRQINSRRDFPDSFMKLEQALRSNLSHQWTVEEMAAMVGLGTTAFTEKVKKYAGFSPLNYLINIRISEAIKLLKKTELNLTDIELDVGFYSSQHFSTTFKKLTGYTPSQFRKNNSSNN